MDWRVSETDTRAHSWRLVAGSCSSCSSDMGPIIWNSFVEKEPELLCKVDKNQTDIAGLTSMHSISWRKTLLDRHWSVSYSGVIQGESIGQVWQYSGASSWLIISWNFPMDERVFLDVTADWREEHADLNSACLTFLKNVSRIWVKAWPTDFHLRFGPNTILANLNPAPNPLIKSTSFWVYFC